MNERLHICTDRILPRDLMQLRRVTMNPRAVAAIAPIGKTWMNGSKLRVKFMGGTAAEHAIVREQFSWWSSVANIVFEFGDDPQSECRIKFDANDGAWSYLGTDCHSIPLDQPTMCLGFLDGGTAAHEAGHFLSLDHEHANPDGGIQWNEEVVLREAAKSPNFWDEATARHNILHKYSADQINGTKFDPDSVMLYWFPPEWTLNGVGTKQNSVLSPIDKMFIAGEKMYPRNEPTHEDAFELTVNGPSVAESIGQFGESDLFFFVAASDGRYVIETDGKSDVVAALFGPGSPTALIDENDDAGSALNARIERGLIAGKYWVMIRHYNKLKGLGNYSIRATKI